LIPALKGRSEIRLRNGRRWIIGLVGAIILASGLYFARLSGSDYASYHNDFNVYYFAAREVLSGRDPYQNRLSSWTPYLYPPVLAELMVPLGLLPLQLAAYIWFVASASSLLIAARLASILSVRGRGAGDMTTPPVITKTRCDRNQSSGLPWTVRSFMTSLSWRSVLSNPANRARREARLESVVALAALLVVSRFALDCLAMGQVNAIVTSLAVAHLYFYTRGRSKTSAVVLAIAASIKLTPAILVIYHLARGRVRFALGSSLLIACMVAASFLAFGRAAASAFVTFKQQTIANGQGFDLGYSGNQSVRAASSRLLGRPEDARRQPYDTASLAISLVLLMGALIPARTRDMEIDAAGPVFCCMVMLSPLAWKAHFVALMVPAAGLTGKAIRAGPGLSRRLLCFAIAAASGLFTLTSARLIGTSAGEWADRHSLVLLGALIIYLAVLAGDRIGGAAGPEKAPQVLVTPRNDR
jgi:alpha-1,2-mannosyltransferase